MKFKKIVAGIIASAMALTAGVVPSIINSPGLISKMVTNAKESLVYENLFYSIRDFYDGSKGVEITGCDGTIESVEIPSKIDDLPVTLIGYSAFYNCSNLKSIVIPDTVTNIGFGAFAGCSSLESIILPDAVTVISDNAFAGCLNLKSINIPASIICRDHQQYGWFLNCRNLESIIIPDSVTSINVIPFRNTPWLEAKQKENPLVIVNSILIDGTTCDGDVTIPDSVTSIECYAFNGCKNLKTIKISNSVTSIAHYAFLGCSNITEITICNPDCEIQDKAMNNYTGIIYGYENSTAQAYAEKNNLKFAVIGTTPVEPSYSEAIQYDDYLSYKKVDENGNGVYDYVVISKCNTSAVSVEIPEKIEDLPVKTIGAASFFLCDNLKTIKIGDSVTEIESEAFAGCTSLDNIVIPDSVLSIGGRAFDGCERLENITFPKVIPSIGRGAFWGNAWFEKLRKENPLVTIDTILIDGIVCNGDVVIPDSITVINDGAFWCSSTITGVNIPESVKTIGIGAFDSCDNLAKITIENPECKIYDSESTISSKAIIYGKSNSTAQAYAEKYNRTFESIGEYTPKAKGDINGDGKVNVADIPAMYDFLLNRSDSFKGDCDINGDEKVDVFDMVLLRRIILQVPDNTDDLKEPTKPTESTEPNETNPAVIYKDILDMFYNNISNNWNDSEDTGNYGLDMNNSGDISYMWKMFDKNTPLSEVGYQFIDINDDGTSELIIGAVKNYSWVDYDQFLYELYAYENGKVIHLASSGERDEFSITEDNKICEVGSGGAFLSSNTYYEIKNGKLIPIENYKYDKNENSENPYFYSNEFTLNDGDNFYTFKNYKSITKNEYENNGHSRQNLNLTMFSEYNPNA